MMTHQEVDAALHAIHDETGLYIDFDSPRYNRVVDIFVEQRVKSKLDVMAILSYALMLKCCDSA